MCSAPLIMPSFQSVDYKYFFFSGEYDIPEQFIPEVSGSCKHGEDFSGDLFLVADRVIIHTDSGDKVLDVKIFGRGTSGKNTFILIVDFHHFCLWLSNSTRNTLLCNNCSNIIIFRRLQVLQTAIWTFVIVVAPWIRQIC